MTRPYPAGSGLFSNSVSMRPTRSGFLLVLLMSMYMLSKEHTHAGIFNIKASYPENYSAEVGIILPVDSWGGGSWTVSFSGYRGPTLSIEAGTQGHKAHVGYGEFGTIYAMRLTGFYMWDHDDHRHVGIQGFVSLAGVCGALGVMRRTDKDSYTATFGVGLGF